MLDAWPYRSTCWMPGTGRVGEGHRIIIVKGMMDIPYITHIQFAQRCTVYVGLAQARPNNFFRCKDLP